jgi:flagellar biogenesis protein FliO
MSEMGKVVTNSDGSVTITLPPRVDHVEIYVLPSMTVLILLTILAAAWMIMRFKNRNSN